MKEELAQILPRLLMVFFCLFLGFTLLFPNTVLIFAWVALEEVSNIPSNIKHTIKNTYEEITMPTYEVKKFNWGAGASFYSIEHLGQDGGAFFPVPNENWMKDAQGNIVASWLKDGDWWGGGTAGGMAKKADFDRLPKTMRVTWYDYADDSFYQLDAELPPQPLLYELMQQKGIDTNLAEGNITTVPRYDTFQVGMGPKGLVILWLQGKYYYQTELAHYQARKIEGLTLAQYNQTLTEGYGQMSREAWFKEQDNQKFYQPETIAKLKSGWTPSQDWYLRLRTKYPYRFTMTGNAHLDEYEVYYGNEESNFVFGFDRAKDEQTLKAVPKGVRLYFHDNVGQRYWMEVKFHEGAYNSGERDLTGIQKVFETLFPNRSAADNDKPVKQEDFASMEFHVNDAMNSMSVDLVKGNQRISIDRYGVNVQKLRPYTFYPNVPEPTPEQKRLIEFGPQSKINLKVKIGEVCPQTGYWSCEYLSSKDGLFMRAGDRMPGQSAVARGDVSADTLWTLVKPEG